MFSPFNMEDLAAGAVEAFKLLGDARAIAVLVRRMHSRADQH